MTNALVLLIYAPLLVINLILLGFSIPKKHKLFVDRLYIVLNLGLIGWQICEMLFYILRDPYWVEFIYSAKFAFAAFLPTLFLLVVAGCYHLQKKIPRWAMAALFVVPALTAVAALTSMHHQMFRLQVEVLSTWPLTRVSAGLGPWYIVNAAFAQVLVVCMLVIIVTQHRKLPSAYRATVSLLLLGVGVFVLGFAVEMFGLDGDHTLDFNLIGIFVSSFLFYIAVSSNGRADYLNIWRRDIFDYLEESVFILNDEGLVVDANYAAERLMTSVGLQMESYTVAQLRRAGAATGKVYFRRLEGEAGEVLSEDLYIFNGKYPTIYRIQRHKILDFAGAGAGEFIVLTECTNNRLLIERLQSLAGIDPLTGLLNRFGYEKALQDLDQPENLPVSIIMSDVNGLKALNDAQSHEAGDALLKKVAEVLQGCCPDGGAVARIGGDEFAVLLKRHGPEDVQAVIADIHRAVNEIADFPYSVSVALGCATKTNPGDNINALVSEADEHMYIDKKSGGAAV